MEKETTQEAVRRAAKEIPRRFEHHVLEEKVADEKRRWLMFRCRRPTSSTYGFTIVLSPGAVCVYGDIGEYVFSHSDADSLEWVLRCCDTEFHYFDYVLSKLRASDSSREVFRLQDVVSALEDMIEEGEGDDGESAESKKIRGLLDEAGDLDSQEQWLELAADWNLDDPPSGMGVSHGALMGWAALRTFARLYATSEEKPVDATEALLDAPPEEASTC